jgi:pimeloyl-ACP methyl ester carboxylesterase
MTSVDSIQADPQRPRRLIVLVPGFYGKCSSWEPLRKRLAAEPGFGPDEAHWLLFDHNATARTIGTVENLARQLHGRIEAEWIRANGFDEVILVGHSMGGLIVRQAYLLGAGALAPEKGTEWARRVVRIVLLASLNRGIDPNRTYGMQLIAWLSRLMPIFSRFLASEVVRGSNFLTNLRINWIRHFGLLSDQQRRGERRAPLIIQLLGSRDGIVEQDDSKDVLAFSNASYLEVPDADHRHIYRLDTTSDPELRYAVLRRAFTGEFSEHPPASRNDSDPIRRVVFLLHGIRASNVDEWVKELERRIRDRDSIHTVSRHPTYGYFTAARFALPSVRRKYIRMFQDWYTEALAEHPNAEFSIVAHSNGSYILGHSLLVTPGMRFENVALAGSVLPTDFPWNRLRSNGQINRLRNDRANRDWPVALLCNALRGLRMHDVGTAGFAGFHGHVAHEIAYYAGGHSIALKPDHQDSLVDFVFGGELKEPSTLKRSPGLYQQLSNAMPYLAMTLVFTVGLLEAWLLVQGLYLLVIGSVLVALATYVVLDIL